MDRTCLVCGDRGPDVQPCIFRVVGARFLVVEAEVHWTNLDVRCCDDCFERGQALGRYRMRAAMLFVFVPLLFMGAGGLLSAAGFKDLGFGILYGTSLLFLILLCFFPLLVGRGTRRRVQEFLGPELDDEVRSFTRVKQWGFGQHLVVLEEVPASEPTEPFPGDR